MVKDLELKVRWLADETGQVGELQRRLDTQAAELVSTKTALPVKEAALGKKIRRDGCLESELSAAPAAIGRREGSCVIPPSGIVVDTPC